MVKRQTYHGLIEIKAGAVGNIYKNGNWGNTIKLLKDKQFKTFSEVFGNYHVKIGKSLINFDYKKVRRIK